MRRHAVVPFAACLIGPALLGSPAWAGPSPAAQNEAAQSAAPAQNAAQVAGPAEPADEGKRVPVVTPPLADDAVEFKEKFVLDTGRIEQAPPDPTSVKFSLHGEYQLRYRAMTDLPLEPPIRHQEANSLGQSQYLYHWLRIGARFQFRDTFAIVGQIDVPRGLIIGDTTRYVDVARDSFAKANWAEVRPRYLYLEYNSPIGVFRVGQQGSYWGMGILANDGDHPNLFGDYRRGAITERVLYATSPLGKGTPLTIILAGDLVFQDNTADLVDGDRTFQGVAAVMYRTKPAEIGVYGVVRHQQRDREAVDKFTPFTESLTVGVVDVAGRFNAPIAGARAFVYGQFEAAMIFGSTTFVRTAYVAPIDPTGEREPEKIRSFGGAIKLGAVRIAGQGKDQWGDIVGEIEAGYASGDANPADGITRRFSFEPNHQIGLVLFNQVLAWKTARAATIAQDPEIVNRPAPGLQFLPSNGAVVGAQYLNPRFIFRPKRWLDLKSGFVIAQTSSDFVDPYHFGALGNAQNYDGGSAKKHNLGVEIDLGIDTRIPIEPISTIQLGADAGVLFPGNAFDDALGQRMANQYLVNVKLGIQY